MTIEVQPYGKFFAVYLDAVLVVVCVYRKGALEVKQRLEALHDRVQQLEGTAEPEIPPGPTSSVREPLIWEEYFDQVNAKQPDSVAADTRRTKGERSMRRRTGQHDDRPRQVTGSTWPEQEVTSEQ